MAHPARQRAWWILAAVLVLVAFGLMRVAPALMQVLGGG
jgi:hypothetical protein